MLASLWVEPLVSQGGQEVFLVPPPTPTYLLRLHIYISAFVLQCNGVVLVCCCFTSATVATDDDVGTYSHSNGKFVQGFSLGAVHSANGIETRRVHYIDNVTLAINQVESSI